MNAASISRTRIAAFCAGVFLLAASFAVPVSAHALTSAQIQSLLNLLVAFGVDQTTLNRVEAALVGSSLSAAEVAGSGGTLRETGLLPAISEEIVREREKDVAVLGLSLSASGADQRIDRITVEFAALSNRDNLEDYVSNVHVRVEDEKLASMDPFDAVLDAENDLYTFTFTGLNYVFPAGDTVELVVTVDGAGSIIPTESEVLWAVNIPAGGIRAISPDGTWGTYFSVPFSRSFSVEKK